MKYNAAAHLVNVLFITIIFVGPIGYCLFNTDIPTDVGRTVIVLSFLLGAFVIADWYHFQFGNSFRGIVNTIITGIILASGSLLVASTMSSATAKDLALFQDPHAWSDSRHILKLYVTGISISVASLVGIPRFLIITQLFKQELPNELGT